MVPNQATVIKPNAPLIPLKGNQEVLDVFTAAADTFVKHENGTVDIWAASRDWFLEPWGRDTFISLPGLLLSTGRYGEAKEVFRHFIEHERNGIIPNRIEKEKIVYNTVDASLLFIHALGKYVDATQDRAFVESLMPRLRSILHHYQIGTEYEYTGIKRIQMDPDDGLIISPPQATWMDADPSWEGTAIVTPRDGKCVEINALWYAALLRMAEWEEFSGNDPAEVRSRAAKVKQSFNAKFWNHNEQCLFDVVGGDPHGAAIRPNQLFAISHGRDLLPKDRQKKVFDAVTRDLLTPCGLRTLSPRDSNYVGFYDTSLPMSEKDLAYHQGTVWPWLMGPYCDALVIVKSAWWKPRSIIRKELEFLLNPLVRFCLESEYKTLPEVFSGDPPHDPGGTTSQAWSVAEVLRVMVEYGVV